MNSGSTIHGLIIFTFVKCVPWLTVTSCDAATETPACSDGSAIPLEGWVILDRSPRVVFQSRKLVVQFSRVRCQYGYVRSSLYSVQTALLENFRDSAVVSSLNFSSGLLQTPIIRLAAILCYLVKLATRDIPEWHITTAELAECIVTIITI